MNPLSLINRILSGDKPEPTQANVPKATPTEDFVRRVWGAPALHNRATRRRVGLVSRIWRWDVNASAEMQRTFVPRYIRRHYSHARPTGTRRQRHRWAKIERITRSKGLL